MLVAGTPAPLPLAPAGSAAGTGSADGSGSVAAGSGLAIEVPAAVGKSVQVAEALITAAGLIVQTRVSDLDLPGGVADAVLEQSPAAGARVQAGSVVTLTYQPQLGAAASGVPFVVVIDAGHQAKPDATLEPDGPGSAIRKAKVSPGVTGIATGQQESVQALAIALRTRDTLKAAGVTVVMVRTADDVNISNSARAKIGNDANASLVVRIHQGFSADTAAEGVTTFYPSGNTAVAPIEMVSLAAAQLIEDAAVQATGARSNPIVGRNDLAGFNYSKVPVVMVECGFLSNRAEDAKMATPEYQAKMASGIAAGVIAFLRSQ